MCSRLTASDLLRYVIRWILRLELVDCLLKRVTTWSLMNPRAELARCEALPVSCALCRSETGLEDESHELAS